MLSPIYILGSSANTRFQKVSSWRQTHNICTNINWLMNTRMNYSYVSNKIFFNIISARCSLLLLLLLYCTGIHTQYTLEKIMD
jgi:hypothetical protein